MTEAKDKMRAAMDALGLTVTAEFVPFSQSRNAANDPGNKPGERSLNWRVTLNRNGAPILTTDYQAGIAHAPSYARLGIGSRMGRGWSLEMVEAITFETEKGRADPLGFLAMIQPTYVQAPDSAEIEEIERPAPVRPIEPTRKPAPVPVERPTREAPAERQPPRVETEPSNVVSVDFGPRQAPPPADPTQDLGAGSLAPRSAEGEGEAELLAMVRRLVERVDALEAIANPVEIEPDRGAWGAYVAGSRDPHRLAARLRIARRYVAAREALAGRRAQVRGYADTLDAVQAESTRRNAAMIEAEAKASRAVDAAETAAAERDAALERAESAERRNTVLTGSLAVAEGRAATLEREKRDQAATIARLGRELADIQQAEGWQRIQAAAALAEARERADGPAVIMISPTRIRAAA